MTVKSFTLPDLGESDSGELVTWLVEAGETVDDGQPVAEVETEKSVVEVPSSDSGTVTELLVDEGAIVEVGTELLRIEVDEPATEPADADDDPVAGGETETPPTANADTDVDEVAIPDGRVFAPPRVRRLARELGVDIATVEGSETSGRISEQDVREVVESGDDEIDKETTGPKPFTPSGKSAVSKDGKSVSGAGVAAADDSGPKPFTPSGKSAVSKGGKSVSGAGLAAGDEAAQSTGTVPQAAYYDTAIVSELTEIRAELEADTEVHGVGLTVLPFILKAVVRTLAEQPTLNATVDADGKDDQRDEYHIGLAVDTDDGLVVPVVQNVNEKTILELAAEIADLIERAEEGDLTPEETEGGTFTLTTVGAIGNEYATLPVDHSGTASLGLGAIEPRPVVEDGAVVARETLPLSLTIDSRAVDSTEGAAFIQQLIEYLESPNRLLVAAT